MESLPIIFADGGIDGRLHEMPSPWRLVDLSGYPHAPCNDCGPHDIQAPVQSANQTMQNKPSTAADDIAATSR
jgi:hypothetical protein